MIKLICIALIGLVCGASGQTTNRVVHASRIIGTPDAQGVPGYLAWDVQAERTTWESMVLGITAEFPIQSAGTTSATWLDWSGEENDGTQATIDSQPSRVKDGGKWVLSFDGQDDWIDTGSTTIGDGLFAGADRRWTVASWAEVPGTTTGSIISRAGGTGADRTLHAYLTSNTDGLNTILRGSTTLTNVSLTDEQWYHHVITWDGTTAKYYLDGAFVTNLNVGTADEEATQRIVIGARTNGTATFLNGSLDDVRLYSTALTAAQIAEIYDSTKNLYPEPEE